MVAHLPRHLPGVPPSARTHNVSSAELDALSRALTVRRTHAAEEIEGPLFPNIDFIIPWETVSGGVNRGKWTTADPQTVTITEAGTYLMLLQIRFFVRFDDVQSYALYQSFGRRWARILLNGTSPLSNAIGQSVRAGVNRTGGTTVQALACRSLQAGDTLKCGIRSSQLGPPSFPNASIRAANLDWGGTYFTLARVGPGQNTLKPDAGGMGGVARFESRSLPSAEAFNVFAQAIDNLGVCSKPRRSTSIPLAANVETLLVWQSDGIDTRGDMWDPAEPSKLVIRISGIYLLTLQVRFPSAGGSNVGERWCTLYRNNIYDTTNVLARDDRFSNVTADGATAKVHAIINLAAGDVLYGAMGSTVAISAAGGGGAGNAQGDGGGGTYLFAARIGRSGEAGSILEGRAYGVDPITDEAYTGATVRGDVIAAIAG